MRLLESHQILIRVRCEGIPLVIGVERDCYPLPDTVSAVGLEEVVETGDKRPRGLA